MIIGSQKKIEELEQMLGKAYMYKSKIHNFLHYRVEGEKITIATKEQWFDFEAGDELYNFLRQCKEWKDEQAVVPAAAPTDSLGLAKANTKSNNQLAALRGILLEDIERLRTDPAYVPVAKQTVNNINAILHTVKIEIQLRKM
jgi:hypothetical protein